jgi:hypothetical protein
MPHTPRPAGSSVVPLAVGRDDAPTVITNRPPGPGVGDRVGPYEVIGLAGEGGMARVLRARDPELGREVAVKLLPPELAADPEAVARFKLEGRAAAQLDHDAVARVFACGEDAGRPYIAFEFVEGETLRDALARRGPLPPAECAALTAQVAAGLAHAADRGVVHRDIKPGNLILTPAGRAKIVDMGLARCDARPAAGDVTKSGMTLGTFDYISPEQALDPRRADARSDIYSLGCTIYHACTGRPPVPPGTAAQKLDAHQNRPVVDPRAYNPAVPLGLAKLLSTMMAKDPARRFQHPRDLQAAATALAAELGAPADPPGSPGRAGRPPDPPPAGRWAGVAAAGVAVAVAVGLLGPPPRGPSAPPWEAPARVPPEPAGGERPKPASPGPVAVVGTVEEWKAAVGRPETTTVRLAGKGFDLTAEPDGLFVGDRPALNLEAADGAAPTVRLLAAGPDGFDRWDRPRPGGLTVAGVGRVLLKGLRFEVAAGPVGEADRPAGVVIADADAVTVDGCRFDPAADPPDAAGLLVVRTAGPGTLGVKKTVFNRRLGGGLALSGRIDAALDGCGFGPAPAAIHLSGPGGKLRLAGCGFMLYYGAAVELGPAADWPIDAGGCTFAALPAEPAAATAIMMGDGPSRPAVVRADDFDAVRFRGRPGEPNVYHGADAVSAGGQVVSVGVIRRPDGPVHDPAAEDRNSPPWASRDPLADLDGRDWARAFRVGPPAAEPAPRAAVWWPDARDPPRHTYARLDDAVRALRPGDELHLRFDGEQPAPAVVWAKPWKLVVRPFPGCSPVLVPTARGPLGGDPAAVRLLDGEVLFDGVGVTLAKPGAAVAVGGGRRVGFRNATVTLADPAAVLTRTTGRGGPVAVALTDTLVRGPGAGLVGDRPAELTAANCWFALGGPLAGAGVKVNLSRVTQAGGPAFAGAAVAAGRCAFAGELGEADWALTGPCWFAESPPDDPQAMGVDVRLADVPTDLSGADRTGLTIRSPDLPPGGLGAGER